MKSKLFQLFMLIALLFAGCKKYYQGATNDKFAGTTYNYLGTWNAQGVPNYLANPADTIPKGMSQLITSTLPEGINNYLAHPELFTAANAANLNLTTKTQVSITFAYDGSGNANTLGFYTYPTNNPPSSAGSIPTITIIFPDAKKPGNGGSLPLGSKVNIGTYSAGTSIGFVMFQSGWVPTTQSIATSAVKFVSADVLNPESNPSLQRHVVLLGYQGKTLICFEDTDRQTGGSDNDFNDIVLYATQVPVP